MINEETRDRLNGTAFCALNSCAEFSDKSDPTAIEKASTKIKIVPVSKMVFVSIPTEAIPDTSPIVETKLSSTPKTKLLNLSEENNCCSIVTLYHPNYS